MSSAPFYGRAAKSQAVHVRARARPLQEGLAVCALEGLAGHCWRIAGLQGGLAGEGKEGDGHEALKIALYMSISPAHAGK